MGAGILVIFTETLTGDALESMVERYKSYFSAIVTFGKDCFSPQDAMVSHLAIESREISKERGGGFIAVSCVPPKDRGLWQATSPLREHHLAPAQLTVDGDSCIIDVVGPSHPE